MIDFIILFIALASVIVLVRGLIKKHKSGGCCGKCDHCSGCNNVPR